MNFSVRMVRFVIKIDVPAILANRVQHRLLRVLAEIPVERDKITMTRGEYFEPAIGVHRLSKRRDVWPADGTE